jgi:hypothetical protein
VCSPIRARRIHTVYHPLMAGVRRADILVGMGRFIVHRSQIGDWVREVSFSRGGGDEVGRDVNVRFRPADETAEIEIVFEAEFSSLADAMAVVTTFWGMPFDRWPGPGVDGPATCVGEPFLSALKRNAVELPDPAHSACALVGCLPADCGRQTTGTGSTHTCHSQAATPTAVSQTTRSDMTTLRGE